MKRMMVLLMILVLGCSAAWAVPETIGYTGFEEPVAGGASVRYVYTATTPMYLPNTGGGQPTVDFTSTGGELGFKTWYNGTDGPAQGTESGDFIGVVNYYNYDGSGSYEMEDCDPECRLELDVVDVSNHHDVAVSAYIKIINPYGCEAGDMVQVYVLVDGSQQIYLFNMEGDDLDDYSSVHGYNYVQYQTLIPNSASTVQVMARVVSNGSSEGLQIDDIEIVGEPGASVDPVCIPPDADLDGDCVVEVTDLSVLADGWITDGYEMPSPPDYAQHVGWDWSDANSTYVETYTVGTASNDPCTTPSGRIVTLVQGPEAIDNDTGQMFVSNFYLARIEGLEDGDKLYVTIKMRSGDAGRWMSLFADHIRYGAYAGGKIFKNIESYHAWGLFTAEYIFDVGGGSYDPRTGMRIGIAGEFAYGDTLAEGDVFGHVDEITISAPYRESGGQPTITIEFPDSPVTGTPNYGYPVNPATLPELCVGNPAADLSGDCYVNLGDLAEIVAEWMDCGWDPVSECP